MFYKQCLLFIVLPCLVFAARLNEYIRHFEPLDYDQQSVHRKHCRAKRSTNAEEPVHFEFHSHRRKFSLRLKRSTSGFSKNLIVEGPNGPLKDVDLSHLYEGEIRGVEGSSVYGSLQEGVFDGKIKGPWGTYYVERSEKYFPYNSSFNQKYHSVIYSENDMIDPYRHIRTGHESGCGLTKDIADWMLNVQYSAVDTEYTKTNAHSLWLNRPPPSNKYTKEAQEWQKDQDVNKTREKRAILNHPERTTCSLFIETDPLFWDAINVEERYNDQKVRDEILSLIGQHVKAVNDIYQESSFNGKYNHRNIQFEVQRTKIDEGRECSQRPQNKFCTRNLDVSNFLNLHSTDNHEDFCLAYVFTSRDFTGGTLGLAWVASAGGASGGICEQYKSYSENIHGIHKTTKRSLNTGIITFVNYNSRVPPKVSQLTLSHEIGHNFGSPHDWPRVCTPGGTKGNYIMFASATSGERSNNNKFSQCSKRNISMVLDAMVESKKRNCFSASDGSFCGNKIVEEGEECDCGYDKEECGEEIDCCYPRNFPGTNDSKRCKRRRNTQCSPSEGPCCSASCQFTRGEECHAGTDCTMESHCDGTSARCPPPKHFFNDTECNGGTQVCLNGECRGSICLKYGKEECFLSSGDIDDKRKLCELACQEKNRSDTCMSTSDPNSNMNPISLTPGSPCDNYQGYCDVFLKCRAVDAEGPLLRLKNILFNAETFMSIKEWVTRYWWGVLLCAVAAIVFMGGFIKFCAVHTPSSNPKQPPPRRITQTLSAPVHTLRRMQRHRRHNRDTGYRCPPGPRAGYGQGRGHYNRRKGQPRPPSGAWGNDPFGATAYPGPRDHIEMRHQKV